MSAEEATEVGSLDVSMVAELLAEPSYLTEVARKLIELNAPLGFDRGELREVESVKRTWGDLETYAATAKVSLAVATLRDDGGTRRFQVEEPDYDSSNTVGLGTSQAVGSMHPSLTSEDGPTKEWETYTIVHNEMGPEVGNALSQEGYQEIAGDMKQLVDQTVTFDEKVEAVKLLSRSGNDVSKFAERIMQDAMERQFRRYDVVNSPGYSDPGVDFAVKDTDRRDYGLVIEVSVRTANPIGVPYIKKKLEKALELEEIDDVETTPWDVLILAPEFTDEALERYEDGDYTEGHADPQDGMVHLHRVPPKGVDLYLPSGRQPTDSDKRSDADGGNPVIVPDNDGLRERSRGNGLVGDSYPVVDDFPDSFIDSLSRVYREWNTVRESRYRNHLREALEPLLPNFMRPYLIEQFLLDMYWDKGLTQSGIGRLVGRSGSTIGRWMREFGVMRRGTGAPELTQETKEIWRRMYAGEEPFPMQYSGFRIQAEWSRHPLWSLDDWDEWWNDTTESQRKETMALQNDFRDEYDYTVMVGADQPLQPSYTFILSTLRDMGVEIREPDEAPRVPYNAYPSRDALEYMLNRNQNTIVDVSEQDD